MLIILIALGSHGDVHPFIGIGSALRDRGHRVVVGANEHFAPLIGRAGLEAAHLGTDVQYRELATHPDLWNGPKAWKVVFGEGAAKLLRPTFDLIASRNVPGDTVVAASSLGLGARCAQEALGVPLATVHLAPSVLRSSIDPPKMPGLFLPRWLPLRVKRAIWEGGDRHVIDPFVTPWLNAFRAEVGLPPAPRGVLREWWHSPDRIIGMWPEWFAPDPGDWPGQTTLAGFPLYDERGVTRVPDALRAFLDDCDRANDRPIVFTPGSAMWQGRRFFASSVEACRRLNRRGVLLTRHRDQIPTPLPPNVVHADYAPFSELLPRAVALVHHGGIGTSAQAMAAGCPQLVTPFAHDQFDNALRMKRLGIAETLPATRYTPRRATAALQKLLKEPRRQQACRGIAGRFDGQNGIAAACDAIEQMART